MLLTEKVCGLHRFLYLCPNQIYEGRAKSSWTFVNKIKSTDAIYLKLPYVCSQFNINQRGKFQTKHLINIVVLTICSMSVNATRSKQANVI